jgi:hypothetical protein
MITVRTEYALAEGGLHGFTRDRPGVLSLGNLRSGGSRLGDHVCSAPSTEAPYWTKGQLTGPQLRTMIPGTKRKGRFCMNCMKRFLVIAAALGLVAGLMACSTV